MPTQHKVDHRFDNHLEIPTLPALPDFIADETTQYDREFVAAHEDFYDLLLKLQPNGEYRMAWIANHFDVVRNEHPGTLYKDLAEVCEIVEKWDSRRWQLVGLIHRTIRLVSLWHSSFNWKKVPNGQYAKLLADAGL